MNNPIEAARARLAEMEDEAEKLRLFIASYEAVAGYLHKTAEAFHSPENDGDKSADAVDSPPAPRTRVVNPPTKAVVDVAIEILRHRGHPMSRRALHESLWMRGVEVKGRDPVKTLGTILWRANDRMVQLEGFGYWPRGIPYPRAQYFPADANQPLPFD